MRAAVPLNAVGQLATIQQATIIGQCNRPPQGIPGQFGWSADIKAIPIGHFMDIRCVHHPGDQPWLLSQRFAHASFVQRKPPRVLRWVGSRIDCDQLEVGLVTKPHQMIVRAHAVVTAASRNLDAEFVLKVFSPLRQTASGNDNVIKTIHSAILVHPATRE